MEERMEKEKFLKGKELRDQITALESLRDKLKKLIEEQKHDKIAYITSRNNSSTTMSISEKYPERSFLSKIFAEIKPNWDKFLLQYLKLCDKNILKLEREFSKL
jgi:excinuclease UvrABC nuclease subunit